MNGRLSGFAREWIGAVLIGIIAVGIGEGVTFLITGRWTLLSTLQAEPLTFVAIVGIAAVVGVAVRRFRPTGNT